MSLKNATANDIAKRTGQTEIFLVFAVNANGWHVVSSDLLYSTSADGWHVVCSDL